LVLVLSSEHSHTIVLRITDVEFTNFDKFSEEAIDAEGLPAHLYSRVEDIGTTGSVVPHSPVVSFLSRTAFIFVTNCVCIFVTLIISSGWMLGKKRW
jgi:hypothetical protein